MYKTKTIDDGDCIKEIDNIIAFLGFTNTLIFSYLPK